MKMESATLFKKQMLLWTEKWVQEEHKSIEELTPDAVEIAKLLRATGFRDNIMEVERLQNETPNSGVPANYPACQVILACPRSGIRIELDAPASSHKYPSPDSSVCHSQAVSEMPSDQMGQTVDFTVSRPDTEISKTVSQLLRGILHVMNMVPALKQKQMEKLPTASSPSSKTAVQHEGSATLRSDCGSVITTPVTNITVVKPNAPCISKKLLGDEKSVTPGRYRSLDTLIASGSSFDDDLPEPGQLTPKEVEDYELEMNVEAGVDLNATLIEGPSSGKKKFISKSSPAVHYTEQFQRSSTFIFEDEKESPVSKDNKKRVLLRSDTYVSDSSVITPEDKPRSGHPPQSTTSLLIPEISRSLIINKLQDLRNTVSDIFVIVTGTDKDLANTDDVLNISDPIAVDPIKEAIIDDVRPTRSVSDFGGVANLTRIAMPIRSIPRPIPRKRTTMTGLATATKSQQGTDTDRRKCVSTTALMTPTEIAGKTATTSKLGTYSRLVTPQSNLRKIFPSPSPKTSTSDSKSTEKNASASSPRQLLTPNRKYTHMQSHIPKATGVLRK